jgi:hypothetical protein
MTAARVHGLPISPTTADLADAIRSVREVVSRVMLFASGALLRRVLRGLIVCDPAGLHLESIA